MSVKNKICSNSFLLLFKNIEILLIIISIKVDISLKGKNQNSKKLFNLNWLRSSRGEEYNVMKPTPYTIINLTN
jgi:hypothetical protein